MRRTKASSTPSRCKAVEYSAVVEVVLKLDGSAVSAELASAAYSGGLVVRSLAAGEVGGPSSAVVVAATGSMEDPIVAAAAAGTDSEVGTVAEGTGCQNTETASTAVAADSPAADSLVAAVADSFAVAADLGSLADAAIDLPGVELGTPSLWLCLSRIACRM